MDNSRLASFTRVNHSLVGRLHQLLLFDVVLGSMTGDFCCSRHTFSDEPFRASPDGWPNSVVVKLVAASNSSDLSVGT